VIVTKTGWFVVVLLFILATVATVGVFKYSRGVELPVDDDPMVAVVVSQVDVPAGTDLNQLIKNDQLRSSRSRWTPWSMARSPRSTG